MSLHRLPKWAVVILIGAFLLLPASQALAADPGTAFTYQGKLSSSGSVVSQSCDFKFSLYDSSSSGSQVGSTLTKSSTSVSNGLFTTSLDFGSTAFTGDAGFLEIAVRCPASSGDYTTLSPRQQLTPVPYAITAGGLDADGAKLTLDADNDTSITVDTDDQIDIEIAGTDEYILTAGVLDIGNGTLARLDLDSDNDTSIRSSADDQIDFETGGSDRVVIDSSGFVGIGTTSPVSALDVSGTTHVNATLGVSGSTTLADTLAIDSTESTNLQRIFSVTTSVTSANNTVFDLDSGGNLSLDGQITLGSAITGNASHILAKRATNQSNVSTGTDIVFNSDLGSSGVTLNTSTGVFTLEANKTYMLETGLYMQYSAASFVQWGWRDSSGGALSGGIDGSSATPTRTAQESPQTTATAIITTTSATGVKVRVVSSTETGTVAADRSYASIVEIGTTDSVLSSDRRLKQNIHPVPSISGDLARLQPVLFDWRSEEYPRLGLATGRQLGLVAQDVEKVLPELVTQGEDGFKRVSYQHIPMLLLQGIKELKAENVALKALVCADHKRRWSAPTTKKLRFAGSNVHSAKRIFGRHMNILLPSAGGSPPA